LFEVRQGKQFERPYLENTQHKMGLAEWLTWFKTHTTKKKKLLKIGNEEKILRTNRDKRYIVTDGRAKNRMQISH
jgi:hypothetical protein